MREFLHSERQLKSIKQSKGKEQRINMCKALEDLYNDGVEKGIEEGIEKGMEKGIEALIETCHELGVSRDDTVAKLMSRFDMEHESALQSVERYW